MASEIQVISKTIRLSHGIVVGYLVLFFISACGRIPTPTIAQPTKNLPATETIIARNIFATMTASAWQTLPASETATPSIQSTSTKSATFTATSFTPSAVTRVPPSARGPTSSSTVVPNPTASVKYDLVNQECVDNKAWNFAIKVMVESDTLGGIRVRRASMPDGTSFDEAVTSPYGDASFINVFTTQGVSYIWIVDQNGIRIPPISAPIMFKTESCTFSTVYFRKK